MRKKKRERERAKEKKSQRDFHRNGKIGNYNKMYFSIYDESSTLPNEKLTGYCESNESNRKLEHQS